MAKIQRRIRSQDEWKKLIQSFESRSVSTSVWCKSHKVSYSNLQKWRKRLNLCSKPNCTSITPSKFDFIPVQVTPSIELACQLEVQLSGGHKFVIKDASWQQVQALILQTVGH